MRRRLTGRGSPERGWKKATPKIGHEKEPRDLEAFDGGFW
ncbi:uncharacterized protein G2W53_032975 [Senna tora]|uniref:Uncharacterized protein n=1 Tax=Senna tora TaxID=362788 RepID=A0A834WCC7_9FABA|nr:uncharacterized protein G2W53_032975 [Senna tora]